MLEQQELLEQGKKEEWIRNELNNDEADESTDGWYEMEEKYEDYSEGLARRAYEKDEEREKRQEERDSKKENIGHVKKLNGFTIVEYEPRDWRLEGLGQWIKQYVKDYFTLYDHKGNIETDNPEVLNILNKKYPNGYTIDGDTLIIDVVLLDYKDNHFFKKINYQGNKKSTALNHNIRIKSKTNIVPALGVETIAETLASVIVNQPNDSGMMIGIFGRWGRGKTFLAEKTWDFLKQKEPKYERVIFSAWKYQDTKASWAYLYESFLNKYLADEEQSKNKTPWQKTITYLGYNKKLWKLNVNKHKLYPLIGLVTMLMLGFVWTFIVDKTNVIKTLISIFGIVTIIQMFFFYLKYKNSVSGLYNKYFSKKSFSEHLGLQSEIENELTNLLKTWIPIPNQHEKVILFVDDIDRCNIEQVISIIDGLRVILDNPEIHKRLIIITAIDENILYQALNHKYSGIDTSKIDEMHKEYLEKIFIIGLKLNHLNSNEIEEFLENILPEEDDTKEYLPENESPENTLHKTVKFNDLKSPSDAIKTMLFERSNYEINSDERKHLTQIIKTLNNATPRKVRIFYYKYLILKQLFHIRLEEKYLVETWRTESDERVIADILIHISNNLDINNFTCNKSDEIIEALKDSANMVSIL